MTFNLRADTGSDLPMSAFSTIQMKSVFQKIRNLLLLLILLATGTVWAQTNKPVRLEFPSEKYSTQQQRILCGKAGVCMVYPTFTTDSIRINIHHYNTNLELLNQNRLSLGIQYIYVAATYNDGKVYLLYQSQPKKKKEETGFLITYRLKDHRIDTLRINSLPNEEIRRLTVHDDNLVFISPIKKNNSNLFFVGKSAAHARGLFVSEVPDYAVEDFVIDTFSNTTVACLNHASETKDNVIWLCKSTLEGNITHLIDLPDTGIYRFQNARIALMDPDKYLVTGTYQYRKSGLGHTADGVYVTIYDHGKFSEPELYAYHPTDASASSTRSYESDILYLPGRIYHDSTRYAFVTESFYPEYRYSTTYTYGVPTTEPIFMGYRFINAEVIVFDTTGQKMWEYSFPFDNMLVTNRTSHLRISLFSDKVLFYYLTGRDLVTMLTNNNLEIIDPIRSSALFPADNKNVQTIYTLSLTPWYDDFYLLSGYRFRNTGNSKSKNPVYFINKLRYQ